MADIIPEDFGLKVVYRGRKVHDRAKINAQLQNAIEAEITKRTREHKRRVDAIKRGVERNRALSRALPTVSLDFLAIGDSWFDYPLNGNDLSFYNTDIVAQLQHLGNPFPTILNYSFHGQATTAMFLMKINNA